MHTTIRRTKEPCYSKRTTSANGNSSNTKESRSTGKMEVKTSQWEQNSEVGAGLSTEHLFSWLVP